MRKTLFLILFAVLAIGSVFGQINIQAGQTVNEIFDGIGTTATATLPTAWKADKFSTVRLVGDYAAAVSATERVDGNSMSSTAGNGIYNFGAGVAAEATDRAIGFLSSSSSTKSGNLYVQLTNNGTASISSFTISYNVEKYRMGTNAAGFSMQMYYSVDGITWTSAGASFLTSFPADATSDGYASAPGATVNISGALPQVLTVGSSFYLAWNYSVTSGTTSSYAQALSIDDVSIIAAEGAPTPTIFVTGTLSSFTTNLGSPSTAQFYPLSAIGLTQNIVITAPTGFEISVDNELSYSSTASVGSNYNGSVYVRMTGANAGPFSGNITHASTGAETVNMPVNGTVTVPVPLITVNPTSLTGFTYVEGSGPSDAQTFTVSGSTLTGNISLTASTNYEISLSQDTGYTSPIILSPTSGSIAETTIYARLKSGLVVGSYNSEQIVASSSGADNKTVSCSGSVTSSTPTTLLLEDNFTGTVGTLLTANGWTNHSGTSNFIPISATDLSYPGYLGTGGGSASLLTTGEDVNRSFTTQSSGDLYFSFLVNVSAAQTTGDYISHIGNAAFETSFFNSRLYIKKNPTSDAVLFGLAKSNEAPVYDTNVYPYGSTVLVIVRHSIVDGTNNDVISMWINPSLGSSAPTPTLSVTAPDKADPANIGRIAIRQGNASNAPTALVDGIRVSTNWADVGGTGSGNIAPAITNISKTPASDIESTDSVQITADVSDMDGTVSTVRLFWGTSTGNLSNTIDMNNVGDNHYQTVENIPAQDNGITVYYNIYAVDNIGGETYSAEMSYLVRDPAITTIPYSQTFSGTFGDTYSYNVAGSNAWYIFNLDNATMNGYNSPLEEDWLVLPGINFNSYSNERMTFNTVATYGSIDADNYLKLMYSTNYHGTKDPGLATWTEIPFNAPVPVGSGAVDTPSGVLDLSRIVGTNVYLAFKYHSTTVPTRWEVDDISIYLSNPVLTVIPETLTGFTYALGSGPSAEQSFSVAGDDLSNNIVVTAPTNYEISASSGTGFTDTITLTQTAGSVPATTIYVRLKSGLAIGTFNTEAITVVSTGAADHSVLCSGEVTAPPAPEAPVALDATDITGTGFTAQWNSAPTATGYYLDVYTEGASITTDLIISEYVEGLSNKKAIEIFNGTGVDVDLANYSIKKQLNGAGDFGNELMLTGTLPNNETYVIALTGTSGTFITGDFVDLTTTSSVMSFNGNDAVALYYNGNQIDVVGVVGQSADWGKDITLVRKSSVLSPTTAYSIADWDTYAVDTLEHLGTHTVGAITYVGTYNNLNVNNVTSYAVTGLTGGITYKYVVRAYNAYGTSGDSNIISVTTTGGGPLDTPVVTISRSGDNVTLNWNAITGANGGYRIEADTNPYGSFAETYTVATGVLTWSQTSAEKKFYRVIALP